MSLFIEEEEKVIKKKKKKIPSAPRHIVSIPNPDKKKYETYKKSHNPIRFPKPFKCCISGRPNSGKSLMALHIIMAHQEKNLSLMRYT
jgi:predicted GTPase